LTEGRIGALPIILGVIGAKEGQNDRQWPGWQSDACGLQVFARREP